MRDLIAKLEKAPAGSLDLTADIYEAIGCEVIRAPQTSGGYGWKYRGRGPSGHVAERWQAMEDLTESLDAAMKLLPPGHSEMSASFNEAGASSVRIMRPYVYGNGATPALAVCVAALRARSVR